MDLVEVFKVLGDENRIRILNLLMTEELCVCEIETILNITQSNASRHLNKLKTGGIIASIKKAQWVYYQIDESFKDNKNLLYQFLENEIMKYPACLKDTERLCKYKNSCFTCEHLREDKNSIVKFLDKQ